MNKNILIEEPQLSRTNFYKIEHTQVPSSDLDVYDMSDFKCVIL